MSERWSGCPHEIESSDDYFVVEVQRDQIESNGDLAPDRELALHMCMTCAEQVQPQPGGLLAKKLLVESGPGSAFKGVTAKLMEAAAKLMETNTWSCGGCEGKPGPGEALVSTEFKTRNRDSTRALLLTLQCCVDCEPRLLQELGTLLGQPVSLKPVEEIPPPPLPAGDFAMGSQVRHEIHGEGEVLFCRSGFEMVKVRFAHGVEKVLVVELNRF